MESNNVKAKIVKSEESKETETEGNNEWTDEHKNDFTKELPTSSRLNHINPERDSHNMNDLRALEFNSADEIRQAMKAVIAERKQSYDKEREAIKPRNTLNIDKHSTSGVHKVDKKNCTNMNRNFFIDDQPILAPLLERSGAVGNRKRPGRPPKAGPSKKNRREDLLDNMYLGKLSNVTTVRCKRRRYGYESDTDNMYTFYRW